MTVLVSIQSPVTVSEFLGQTQSGPKVQWAALVSVEEIGFWARRGVRAVPLEKATRHGERY